MIVFEYGSGGSSFLVTERVKQLYSVDHDEEWYRKVKELIDSKNIGNIEYFFVNLNQLFRHLGLGQHVGILIIIFLAWENLKI